MTHPPPSPYGPSSPTPPSYAQQQPAMFRPPQVSYGYPVLGPTPPKQGNGPGLAALVLGIAAMVTAFIPFVNVVSFLLAMAGIILGIIGLALADRPRRAAVWGLVLSAVSMVIAFVMVFVYTFAFAFGVGGAVEEAYRNQPTVEASPFGPEPVEAVELSSDPLPQGTMATVVDGAGVPSYEATVMASTLDASGVMMDGDDDAPPPAGTQWAVAQIELYTLGDIYTSPAVDLIVEYIDPDGVTHSPLDTPATVSGVRLGSVYGLEPGLGAVAFVVIAIPTENPAGGQWSIQFGRTGSDGERYFFAAE